jgi:catechol 2,3-dioxygenase-like lactoylglutathione lyase family enzyme
MDLFWGFCQTQIASFLVNEYNSGGHMKRGPKNSSEKERVVKNNLVLELHVPDFDKVKNFYSKLGFQVVTEDPIGQSLGYLVMRRKDPLGETLINFYGGDDRVYDHSFFADFGKNTRRGYEVEITIPVSDVADYYNRVLPHIRKNLVQELTLKRWGKKDFRIVDPFGFYLRFTELVDWVRVV